MLSHCPDHPASPPPDPAGHEQVGVYTRSLLTVVATGALALALTGCSGSETPQPHPTSTQLECEYPGAPSILASGHDSTGIVKVGGPEGVPANHLLIALCGRGEQARVDFYEKGMTAPLSTTLDTRSGSNGPTVAYPLVGARCTGYRVTARSAEISYQVLRPPIS